MTNQIDDYKEKACRNIIESSKGERGIVTTLVIGGVLGSIGGFVLGGAAAAWMGWNVLENEKKKSRSIDYLEEGVIAPFLSGIDFKKYLKLVGSPKVASEIDLAIEENLLVTDIADDWYYGFIGDKELPEDVKQLAIAANDSGEPSTFKALDTVESTRLNLESLYNSDEKQVFSPGVTNINFPVIEQLTGRVQNVLIVAKPGAGKDFIVSHCSRELRKTKKIFLFLIDGKNDDKEHKYSEGVFDKILRVPNPFCTDEQFVQFTKDAILQFEEDAIEATKHGYESLLVINEGTRTGEAFKACRDNYVGSKINAYASSGDSRGMHIWLCVQAPQLDAIGVSGAVRSQLLTICIVHESDLNVVNSWQRTGILGKPNDDELKALLKKSPVNRVIFSGVDKTWYPVPKLENYSGYNRDTKQHLNGAVQDSKVVDSDRISDSGVTVIQKPEVLTPKEQGYIDYIENTMIPQELMFDEFNRFMSTEDRELLKKETIKLCKLAGREDLLRAIGIDV